MPRQCRRAPGQQWTRNLRNVPARQAEAVAAPPANPPPLIPPPAPPPPQPEAVRARAAPRRRAPPPRPIRPAGQGEKNIDNAFIRNRGRYKIKRILAAPKNVDVKHRGRTVRRMVVRRCAIYPALRQQ